MSTLLATCLALIIAALATSCTVSIFDIRRNSAKRIHERMFGESKL